jgi:hypothetical protein
MDERMRIGEKSLEMVLDRPCTTMNAYDTD